MAAGDTFVFAHGTADAAILAAADLTTAAGLWNGDDAIVLEKAGTVVDSIGQLGIDPGTAVGYRPHVDRREHAASCGFGVRRRHRDPSDAFDPAAEWVGFAQNTFDGLGSHTADCGVVGPQVPVINEFSASTVGTDVEYVELLVEPGTDLSAYRVLEIEGDFNAGTPTTRGVVDEVISFGAPDADGRALASLATIALENGTVSLLLVTGFAGALGNDLDTNDDGVLELPAGVTLVDSIAINDGRPAI